MVAANSLTAAAASIVGHRVQTSSLESTSATTTYHRMTVDGVGVVYREAAPKKAPAIVEWQAWLREHKPPTLVVWGRNDPSFIAPGAEAFKRDLPDAEIHLLDAGHFALDEKNDEIAKSHSCVLGQTFDLTDRLIIARTV